MTSEITILRYAPTYKKQWDTLVDRARNPNFFFRREYMEYHRDRFSDFSLLAFRNGNLAAVLPGNIVEEKFYSHQGLTFGGLIVSSKVRAAESGIILKSIFQHLKESSITHMIYKKMPYIYSIEPCDDDIYHLIQAGANLKSCHLNQVIDYRHFSISSERRRFIKKSRRRNIVIEESKDFFSFWSLLERNLSQHDARPTHTLDEIQFLANVFPQHIKLICAYHNAELLCGTVIFVNENVAHTQYIASSPEARTMGALDLLLFETCESFSEKAFFSFGTSNESEGAYLNEGLAFYKESFGARGVAHVTYDLEL